MMIRNWTISAAALALATFGVACDGGSTDDGDSADYQAAVPGMQMMTMDLDSGGTTSSALEAEDAAEGTPGSYRAHAKALMDKVNALLAYTHEQAAATFEDAVPRRTTQGSMSCRVWEADGRGGKAHWRLTSCLKDQGAKKFAYRIEGRPIDSTSDGDYLVVFAGEGKVLPLAAQPDADKGKDKGPKSEGLRGSGHLGYNFDNLATLTGKDVAGTMGIGYKGLGMARHLVLALDGVRTEGSDDERSGIWRFKRVIGKGGQFSFVGPGDFVTDDGAGNLIAGQDGTDELGRAAIAWKASGDVRTVLTACGGTVGEGQCITLAQCWTPIGDVAHEEATDAKGKPKWDKKCAEVPYAVDVPSEGDLDLPSLDSATDAPIVDEPAAAE